MKSDAGALLRLLRGRLQPGRPDPATAQRERRPGGVRERLRRGQGPVRGAASSAS